MLVVEKDEQVALSLILRTRLNFAIRWFLIDWLLVGMHMFALKWCLPTAFIISFVDFPSCRFG